ncbi:MAG TPA: hypothetical protein VMB73_10740 [Acetobacteraceae bacterium]|nr:hypothetical protein [Acetobacteraceae bacterium]
MFDALRGTAWLGGSLVLGLLYSASLPALVVVSLMARFGVIPVLLKAREQTGSTGKAGR